MVDAEADLKKLEKRKRAEPAGAETEMEQQKPATNGAEASVDPSAGGIPSRVTAKGEVGGREPESARPVVEGGSSASGLVRGSKRRSDESRSQRA